jgi:outer membrane immunogenic protein
MKLLLGTTMIAGLMIAGAAQAADMPLKAPPRAAPVYNDWTGFYLGVHGGYGWGKGTPDDASAIAELTDSPFHNPKPKGGVFGGHAGYNWQTGRFVGGLEVDYSFAKLKETQSFSYQYPVDCDDNNENCSYDTNSRTLSSKVDALASARARAGFLVSDSLLAYGTAGIGWARSQASATFTNCLQCDTETFTAKSNNFGWVAGGGLEYKLTQNILLRGEYLHYDFGSVGYAFESGPTVNAKLTVDVARGGLSFKF